jgi:hypothetical protein
MLNRPMSRLATVAATAGTVCVLGAAAAGAAAVPASSWSGPRGPVPHAHSNATPALTQIFLTGTGRSGTLVAWKGQVNDDVFYITKISGHWSAAHAIPGARTSAGPSVGFYPDPTGHAAVLAVWKQLGGRRIVYSQGQTHSNGTITWTAPVAISHSKFSTTGTAPAVFFPGNAPHARVVVAWRGPFNHVRYSVGTPSGRHFRWSSSHWLSSASNTRTSAAPALAEVQTGKATGKLYVFWKGYKSTQVRYATTSDPLSISKSGLKWSAAAVVPGAATGAGPTASALGSHLAGPLGLAYKAPHSLGVRFQTLAGSVWSPSSVVPQATTAVGPALLRGTLATTSPNASGRIFLHIFS